jgi:nucleotide-binding universal stress UspA family protein
MKRVRRIIHPSDFSTASRAALARATELARESRAALTFVHVMTPVVPFVDDSYVPARVWDDAQRHARAYAQKQIDKLVARARGAGIRANGVLLEGVPADRIVREARSKHAGLIVMGTHGRSGLAKFVLGSVAERVVAMADCPVLTVRGRRAG